MDLHVRTPCGKDISFSSKTACGGVLDIDRNASSSRTTEDAIENIYFETALPGEYTVAVKHYNNRGADEATRYLIRIKRGGESIWREGAVLPKQQVTVHRFSWL